jgi:hypothetical protein
LLTYRPWRLRPRVEEAPIDEYAGVRTDAASDQDGGGTIVALVSAGGEVVPMRQFKQDAEARRFADDLAKAAQLWVRHAGGLGGDLATPDSGPPAS